MCAAHKNGGISEQSYHVLYIGWVQVSYLFMYCILCHKLDLLTVWSFFWVLLTLPKPMTVRRYMCKKPGVAYHA